MANDLVWDRRMLELFKAAAFLTDEEELVLKDWVRKKSIINTAMIHHMSERKINYIRKQIRQKYDRVQVYIPDLPPRRTR